MEIKSKFEIGQEVCLFNGVSLNIEHDEVYAILIAPQPVAGKEFDPQEKLSKAFEKGLIEVGLQYQLRQHQGLLDERILFGSEEECKAFFKEFFEKQG